MLLSLMAWQRHSEVGFISSRSYNNHSAFYMQPFIHHSAFLNHADYDLEFHDKVRKFISRIASHFTPHIAALLNKLVN